MINSQEERRGAGGLRGNAKNEATKQITRSNLSRNTLPSHTLTHTHTPGANEPGGGGGGASGS